MAFLLVWGSFGWGLPAEAPAATGESKAAAADPWAGVRVSDAYDYARCPQCGKKNELRAERCSRCDYEFPQPSPEMSDPAWVFVPGKGYYKEGALLEPVKTRKIIITTGYALIAAGVAAVMTGAAYAEESDGVSFGIGVVAGTFLGAPGGALLIIGYATRKKPIYALNPGALYINGPGRIYARRSPGSDGLAFKVEVTALGF